MFELIITTPQGTVYKGHAKSVNVPTVEGRMQILANHANVVTAITSGTMTYSCESGEVHTLDNKDGFMTVIDNRVSVVLETEETK